MHEIQTESLERAITQAWDAVGVQERTGPTAVADATPLPAGASQIRGFTGVSPTAQGSGNKWLPEGAYRARVPFRRATGLL